MSIYISSKTIDFVQLRTSTSKLIMIITKNEKKIKHLIHKEIDRGFTKIESIGGYNGEDRTMILGVTGYQETVQLKKWLEENDPESFVVIMNSSYIIGRGFKIEKYHG